MYPSIDLFFNMVLYLILGEDVDLLKGVSGYLEPGTMTALMGTSGAGIAFIYMALIYMSSIYMTPIYMALIYMSLIYMSSIYMSLIYMAPIYMLCHLSI